MNIVLHDGDCLLVLPTLAVNSLDACVTDPPYGLEFMGKEWDKFRESNSGIKRNGFEKLGQNGTPSFAPNRRNQKCPSCGKWAYDYPERKCVCGGWKQPAQLRYSISFQKFSEQWAREVFRVLKPGAHLLAFGGTRTYHRMACAIEDAGFEIRDCIQWLYGSGFPKSHDVSKGIDRAAGAERPIIGKANGAATSNTESLAVFAPEYDRTTPATEAARQWQGWGTALKPACELIILARKPFSERTVAANVLRWGTGAMNIDGTRIATDPSIDDPRLGGNGEWHFKREQSTSTVSLPSASLGSSRLGRWPANLIHDGSEEVMEGFPETGTSPPVGSMGGGSNKHSIFGDFAGERHENGFGDIGSAARFFYTAKADSDDRLGSRHPTVKPLDLMQYLVRLVTPKGGTVLDPFAGTGSTGEAAFREGMRAVLIEREPEYQADIRRRIELVLAGPDERAYAGAKERMKDKPRDDGPLFDRAL